MFDFECLEVYKKSKELSLFILEFLRSNKKVDSYIRDQLKRAIISAVINIAEGSGKFSKPDKRKFYIISRGSIYESVSLIELIRADGLLSQDEFNDCYVKLEIISKMLSGLINSQK
jgi:four helix bundle protein